MDAHTENWKILVRHSTELLFAFTGKQAVIRIIEQQIFIIEKKIYSDSCIRNYRRWKVQHSPIDPVSDSIESLHSEKKLAENMSDDPVTPERMQE